MSTAAADASPPPARHGRGAVRQGTRRREFPGRLVADPPRPAGACARLLPLRPQRRRHRRQPGLGGGRQDPPARPDGGDPGRRARRPIRRPPAAMRASLAATGVTAQHCHDVLHAFRQDAVKLRYRDWDDLMEYCRYSAVAGRPAAARSARRGPRHLAGLGRAVRRAAGAQPSAGLRRRLPQPRPRLPAARRSRGGGLHGRGARRTGGQPGAAPRARPAARQHRGADRDRAAPAAAGSRRAGCAGNRRSSSHLPAGWRAGCGAAIRWPAGSSCPRAISRPRS